jgi:hypothetical protein
MGSIPSTTWKDADARWVLAPLILCEIRTTDSGRAEVVGYSELTTEHRQPLIEIRATIYD